MRTYNRLIICILLPIVFATQTLAEGTKEISPDQSHQYFVQIRNGGERGCFGTSFCNDIYSRILFEIKQPGERVYFGAKMYNSFPTIYNYQITKLDGTIVQSGALPKVSTSPGYIPDYEKACIGPTNVAPGGYTALSFLPADSGTYIFNFDVGTGATDEYTVEFFDLTVASSAGAVIRGRLYAYNWNFTTTSDTKKYKGKMYPITADSVVTEIDFNGMRPYSFSVSCNLTGCFNNNNFIEDRRSVNGRHSYPQYKVFFNNPDASIFPSGTLGQLQSIDVVNECDEDVHIVLWANKPGLCDIMLDIDPTPGYQPADIFLAATVEPGVPNTIDWNGLDGTGGLVPSGTQVGILVTFVNGRTNLPLYDVEYGQSSPGDYWNGFMVNLVRPVGPKPKIFWCDTLVYNYAPPGNFPAQALELNGCDNSIGCHTWDYGVGDANTVNTWWYSLTSSQDSVELTYKRSDFVHTDIILCEGDSMQVFGNWVSEPGVFTQVGTNYMGCDSTSEVEVTVLPGPVLELGPDQLICYGESTTLGQIVPGVVSYEWNTVPAGPTPLSTTPTLQVNATNTYSVTITAANGCLRTDQTHVEITPQILPVPIKHN